MPIFDSFEKDWKTIKSQLGKKPAMEKHILLWTKRVSSGIGPALKRLDKCIPADEKTPTNDEVHAYANAVTHLGIAVKEEGTLIDAELKKTSKEDKNSRYRELKIFKTKLAEYLASAEQQLLAYEQAADGQLQSQGDDNESLLRKIKAAAKKEIAQSTATLKWIHGKPQEYSQKALEIVNSMNRLQSELAVFMYKPKNVSQEFAEVLGDSFQSVEDQIKSITRATTPDLDPNSPDFPIWIKSVATGIKNIQKVIDPL